MLLKITTLALAMIPLAACIPADRQIETPAQYDTDPNWQNRFSPDVPYYNQTGAPVPGYDIAGFGVKTADIAPGDGGFVKTCAREIDRCQITYGGSGNTAWVDMNLFDGVAG